jgi:hypothetical protein
MKNKALAIAVLLIITVLYFSPVIFSRNTFIARDIYIFYNPKHFFAAENIKQGTLPLWNPYLSSGVPFQANIQSCVFYPLSIIYYLLSFQIGYKYFIIVHYFLGSLFMFLLMRAWGNGLFAAVIAGMVFSYGGYLVSIIDNVCFLAAAVWLPLILLFHHRALKTGSLFYSLVTSLCFAMQLFAGDASFYILSTLLTLSLYTLLWPVIQAGKEHYRGWVRSWILLVVTIAVGLLIASIQLIPMIELVLHSTRFEGLTFETVTKWSYHPLEFLQLLVPFLFGTTVPETRWFGQPWLDTCYLGILPLIFAMVFIFCCREKIRYFLITLLLCSLFLSLGQYNPLFKLVYRFLPGMNMLQYPVKFLFPGAFCLSIMAGAGAAYFFDKIDRKEQLQSSLKLIGICFFILLSLLVIGGFLQEQLFSYFQAIYPQNDYFQGIEKESFFSLFKGLSTAVIFFSLFFIIIGASFTGKLSTSLGRYLVIAVIFCDLAFIAKTDSLYVPEKVFNRKISTTNYLKQEMPPARIFSLYYLTSNRSFLHVYQVPFIVMYKTFQEVLIPNINVYYHIPTVDEYKDMALLAYFQLFSPVHGYFRQEKLSSSEKRYRSNILNLLNVKYLISTLPLQESDFRLIHEGPVKIYENPTCMPRAFFAEKLLLVESEKDVLKRMEAPSFDPGTMVYISKKEMAKLNNAFIPDSATEKKEPFAESVQFSNYQPNCITLKTHTNQARFLVLSDNYYPGWRAYVNGREQPVLRVNYTLRGLLLDKGSSTVTFVFRPQSLVIGAWISGIVLVCVFAGLVLLRPARYLNKP